MGLGVFRTIESVICHSCIKERRAAAKPPRGEQRQSKPARIGKMRRSPRAGRATAAAIKPRRQLRPRQLRQPPARSAAPALGALGGFVHTLCVQAFLLVGRWELEGW